MSDTEHSPLGASKAHRWLNCPGSVAACAGIPDVPGDAAKEGTRAHELAARALANMVGRLNLDAHLGDERAMAAGVNKYLVECYRVIDKGAAYWVEKRFDLQELHPQLFGTADCVAVLDGTLHVWDFKSGYGRVDAAENPQLAYYALGALTALASEHAIDRVIATIVQPRIGHIDAVEWSPMDLMFTWGTKFQAGAEAADKLDAPRRVGDWCKYCPAAVSCPAMLAAAETAPKMSPDVFTADQLGHAVKIASGLDGWIKRVKAEALARAMKGAAPTGYKAVAGRQARFWKDGAEALLMMQMATGADVDGLSPRSLMTPAQFEDRYGDESGRRMAIFTDKSPAAPTLVAVTDKRAALPPRDITADIVSFDD